MNRYRQQSRNIHLWFSGYLHTQNTNIKWYSHNRQSCSDRTFQITTSWPRGHKTRCIYPHKCKFRPIRWLECVPHLRSGPSHQKHHKTVYSRRHSHFLSPRSKTEDFIVFHANTRCLRMSGFFIAPYQRMFTHLPCRKCIFWPCNLH